MKRTITRKKNKSRKTVLKKKIIEVKNEDDNELPLIKTPMIRKGFYDSQKECKKDETNHPPVTNRKFSKLPKKYDQMYYTAGDRNDFEKFGLLPLRLLEEPDKNERKFKNVRVIPFYKNYDFESIRLTFDYIYNKIRKAIFISIKSGKVDIFLPFEKENFKNSQKTIEKLFISEKEKDLTNQLKNAKNKNEKKRLQKLLKIEFLKFEKKIGRKIDSEKRNWFVQNSLVKADLKGNRIGDHSTNVFREFFENLCEERTISDCEFFLNTRDFPILTQKLTEPYEAIHGDSEELPEYYKNKLYCPVFSQSIIPETHADLLIPTEDDMRRVSSSFFLDDWKKQKSCQKSEEIKKINWDEKKNVVFFRGKLTGSGKTIDTNVRLKAADYGSKFPKQFDVGITSWNMRLKKSSEDSTVDVINPADFNFDLKPFVSKQDQQKFKYILNLDGNVSAFRLGDELLSGSLVLIADSKYKTWIHGLIQPYVHYIPVKHDLSNLKQIFVWCQKNDEKCKEIVKNAGKLKLDKKCIYDFMEKQLNDISISKNIDFNHKPKIDEKKKKKICLITVFREDSTKKREKQKNHFIKIMTELFKDLCELDILIIEQSQDGMKFNIGKTKNIGYDVIKNKNYDHLIFSDIDIIPDSDLIHHYLDVNTVTALGVRGSRYTDYTVNTQKIFMGSVFGIKSEIYKRINGFPSNFVGWGYEDEALSNRLKYEEQKIEVPDRGTIIDLEEFVNFKEKKNFLVRENIAWEKLDLDRDTYTVNGLSNLKYKILEEVKNSEYPDNVKHLKVDLLMPEDIKNNEKFYSFKNLTKDDAKLLKKNLKKI